MPDPSVGVIIPCFNSGKFLEKTLNSVLSQNYPISEIIVVDDGSTDNTMQILRHYGSRLTILHHENHANKGQAESLNLGIYHLKSELVAFLDHDDIWYEDKIQKQVNIFKNMSNVGLCYVNGFVIDENDKKLYSIIPKGFKEKNQPWRLLLDCYIRTPSLVMVRRSLFSSVGYFPNLLQAPDHDMWIKMIECTNFFYVDQDLVGYRQHSNQISLTNNRKMWESQFVVLQNAMQRYPYTKLIQRKRKSVLYYRLGIYDFHQKNFFLFIKNFSLAFFYDPLRAIKCFFRMIKSKF